MIIAYYTNIIDWVEWQKYFGGNGLICHRLLRYQTIDISITINLTAQLAFKEKKV
jgi:hypothetical protein